MTPEERSQMGYLCETLATEKELKHFESIVEELMALIDRKHKRLQLD